MFSDDPMNNTNNGNMLIQQQRPMPTFLEASPNMGTPFLESSTMDTPFLDNNSADTPPFFDIAADISPYLIYGSFNMTPYNNTFSNGVHNKQDICVAGYLNNYENNIAQLAHDPIATFNGDPSVLLIDKSKNPLSTTSYQPSSSPLPLPSSVAVVTQDKPSPAVDLVETTVAEEESDSLFPPLTSSQQELATTIEHETIKKENVTLDDILGFDHTSPLSESIEELSEQQELEESGYKQKEEEIPSMIKKEKEEAEAEEKVKKSRRGRKRKYPITEKKQKKEDNSTRKRSNLVKKPKEVKLYYCHICNHVSKRRYNLMTHIKTHDKSRIKEFGCTICEKRFDRRHDRDRHLATVHRGERSFTCKHCTTHFSRRDALNRHLIQRHEYNENDFVE